MRTLLAIPIVLTMVGATAVDKVGKVEILDSATGELLYSEDITLSVTDERAGYCFTVGAARARTLVPRFQVGHAYAFGHVACRGRVRGRDA